MFADHRVELGLRDDLDALVSSSQELSRGALGDGAALVPVLVRDEVVRSPDRALVEEAACLLDDFDDLLARPSQVAGDGEPLALESVLHLHDFEYQGHRSILINSCHVSLRTN